jgi:hypothetical protein
MTQMRDSLHGALRASLALWRFAALPVRTPCPHRILTMFQRAFRPEILPAVDAAIAAGWYVVQPYGDDMFLVVRSESGLDASLARLSGPVKVFGPNGYSKLHFL